MKFCPVVPEICCGQVHVPQRERKKERKKEEEKIFEMSATFNMAAKTRHENWAVKIQHCPISSKF
jgi:hypothetical protein